MSKHRFKIKTQVDTPLRLPAILTTQTNWIDKEFIITRQHNKSGTEEFDIALTRSDGF